MEGLYGDEAAAAQTSSSGVDMEKKSGGRLVGRILLNNCS